MILVKEDTHDVIVVDAFFGQSKIKYDLHLHLSGDRGGRNSTEMYYFFNLFEQCMP